jgi:hypothetical protein
MFEKGNGRHEDIVYLIRNFILEEDRWHKPDEVLHKFFDGNIGKNSANARELRRIMHEIYADETFHRIIIFGPKGYRGARNDAEARQFETKIGGILSEYGEIHEAVKHQRLHHDQGQFAFSKNNIQIVDAFIKKDIVGQTSFILDGVRL